MKIALDTQGGDRPPEEIIRGGIEFTTQSGSQVIFVGDENVIIEELRRHSPSIKHSILHAPGVIAMEEEPSQAILKKLNSSLFKGVELVEKGLAEAFVSPANTGAIMVASLILLGRIAKIKRPGIILAFPTRNPIRKVLVIDVGASADCLPRNLYQFALMGRIYATEILGISNPSLGLLNIGQEEVKGNALTKATHTILKENKFPNYRGYVEGNKILHGEVDIVVCDGSTGNITLKAMEDTAAFVGDLIINNTRGARAKLGAWLLRPVFREIRTIISPSQYGGASLLGVNGIVIIAHGNSDAEAIKNALRVAERAYKNRLVEKLEEGLKNLVI